MKFLRAILTVLVAVGAWAPAARADNIEIKIASLAPEGSPWAKLLSEGGKDLDKATSGRVKIKYFFSAQQGDEKDVVRKMKLAQLDGAALTAVGLGLVKSDVRVLELPFLVKNDKELDYVREKMAPEFEKQFDDAGYVLISWGDVGWVHLYSNTKVESRADLAKTKMWAWTDDPIVKTFFKRLGINGRPLGVPDVLPNLETGYIDACYGPPAAAVGLQWWTKVKYGTATPISYSIGALVIRKEVFNKISADDQKIMREQGKKLGEKLMKVVRTKNDEAKEGMEDQGIEFVKSPEAMIKDFEKEGQAVWDELAGSLYSKELLEKVKKYVAEARAK
jgi:TRAP-type C4-dicarboxylate transport system substrate-binding protein